LDSEKLNQHRSTRTPQFQPRTQINRVSRSRQRSRKNFIRPNNQHTDREQWLWQNPQALASVKCGLAQAAKGEVHDLGDFSEYAEKGD
jgi:hypothetical protein